jgi:hypothetical protein
LHDLLIFAVDGVEKSASDDELRDSIKKRLQRYEVVEKRREKAVVSRESWRPFGIERDSKAALGESRPLGFRLASEDQKGS